MFKDRSISFNWSGQSDSMWRIQQCLIDVIRGYCPSRDIILGNIVPHGYHRPEISSPGIPSTRNIIPQGVRPSGVSFPGDITPRKFMNFLVFCYIKTQTRFIPSKILNRDQCHRTTFIVVFFNVNFQSCSRGYTRRRRPFGECVRCQCHVHAAECDEYTGVCKVTLIIYNKQTGL